MTTKSRKYYTPEELKTLFEALSLTPSYLSKRFVLQHMVGFTEEDLRINISMMDEENTQRKIGNNRGLY
jgi:hypothetical protein